MVSLGLLVWMKWINSRRRNNLGKVNECTLTASFSKVVHVAPKTKLGSAHLLFPSDRFTISSENLEEVENSMSYGKYRDSEFDFCICH